jgi:hypothetical protein
VAGPGVASAAPDPTLLFEQLGLDIDGEAAGDYSGSAVALSADGMTLAIGARRNDGGGGLAGQVRVYIWDDTDGWVQQGADIDGEDAGDESGLSVALSADGMTLAIGAYLNDGIGTDAGQVRVYIWDGADGWVQQGADIDGEAAYDQSGLSVALSDDGMTLAIGAYTNDGGGTDAGQVRVYIWDDTDGWVQQGADIDGEAAGDYSGYAVALSADGTALAIGAPFNGDGGDFAGQVRVYTLDRGGWVQQGDDIDGEAAVDLSGWSVALSADGMTLAIGAHRNDGGGDNAGQVRVYIWDDTDGWVQQGVDIDGEAAGDLSGRSVALSDDGMTLAIGADFNDGGGDNNVGHVRVYTWNGSVWVQQGGDIDGEAAGDLSGSAVALSADGMTLAIGARYNDGGGDAAGQVRVYVADAPVLVGMPDDITVEAAGSSGTPVDYTVPTATDSGDPAPDVTCGPVSGSVFPVGSTTVTCTATDSVGNSGADTFTVTVTDTTAPSLVGMPDDITVEAAGSSGTPVGYTVPTATDTVDPAPDVTCGPVSGATFPVGSTTVTCTATDDVGNDSTATFGVMVADTVRPSLVLSDELTSLGPFTATGADGAVVGYAAPVSDDPDATVSCDRASGSMFPVGITTVMCTATDDVGNVTIAGFDVEVVAAELAATGVGSVPTGAGALLLLAGGGLLLVRARRTRVIG